MFFILILLKNILDDHFKINSYQNFSNKNIGNITGVQSEKKEAMFNNNINVNNFNTSENIVQKQNIALNEDEKMANEEHNKCVVKALKEAIDENEMVIL